MALSLATVGGKITAAFINLIVAQVNLQGTTRVIPTAATNGTVSATGVVTSTAQSLVRVRDAFPSGPTFFRVTYDVTCSAAAALLFRLALGATDASTAYDNQLESVGGTAVTTAQSLAATSYTLSGFSVAGYRHNGTLLLWSPNVVANTIMHSQTVSQPSAGTATASSGVYRNGFGHRTATAYESFTIFAASGNVTVNDLRIESLGG